MPLTAITRRSLPALVAMGFGALLLGARGAEFVGPPSPADEALGDPLPIRRVLLPKEHLAAEVERVRQGAQIRLSRGEFEDRVRRAARGAIRPADAPRLVEARWRARLLRDSFDENGLVGSAELKIVHAGTGPGLLPLDVLQVALRDPRWTDNRPAILGLLEPGPRSGMALLVSHHGRPVLNLDWSARAVPGPGELRFDLSLAACPIATLDLDLPEGIIAVVHQEGTLLVPSEPHEGRRTWRVHFGGLSRLELSLRPGASAPATLLAGLATRQDLAPDSAACQYAFDFKVPRGDVTDLTVEHDAELVPADVTATNLESWRPLPGTFNGRKRIAVRLHDPVTIGQLKLTASAPIAAGGKSDWHSPAAHLVGATQRGETVSLRLAPELRLDDLQPGSFRLVRNSFATDGSQVLTLDSTLHAEGRPTGVRPAARFGTPATEFSVGQRTVWDVGAERATLTSQMTVNVRRGSLSRLGLQVPPGWEVEQVEAVPRDAGPTWSWSEAGSNMDVEFAKPLAAGSAVRLSVRLRGPGPDLAHGRRQALSFPDLVPTFARERSGLYVIRVSPALLADAPAPSDVATSFGPLPDEADGGNVWRYPFHGRVPSGPLLLTLRSPVFQAYVETTVRAEAGMPRLTTHIGLQPESGGLSSIVLTTSAPVAEPWTWRTVQGTNQVLTVEPLPLGRAFAAVAVLGVRLPIVTPAGLVETQTRWWRMTFARPLDSPLTIESSYVPAPLALDRRREFLRALAFAAPRSPFAVFRACDVALDIAPLRQEVPLVRVPGAAREGGTVTVELPENGSRVAEGTGLIPEGARQARAVRRETFRTGGASATLCLTVGNVERQHEELTIDGAELTSVAGRDSHRSLFRFRVRGWPGTDFPVRLPASAELLGVAVEGRTLPGELCRLASAAGASVVSFPVPGGPAWYQVEILYSIPAPSWTFSTHLDAPLPTLPATPPHVRTVWRLPPGVLPLTEDRAVRLPPGPTLVGRQRLPDPATTVAVPDSDTVSSPETGRVPPAAKESPGPRTFLQSLLSAGGAKPLLDTLALAEADVHEKTPAPVHGWEELGLTLVPFAGGSVLTTPRQKSIWRADAPEVRVPPGVLAAFQEAAESGRDASGRFRSVADWAEFGRRGPSLIDRLGGDGPGWTAWETRDGVGRLEIADTGHVSVTGWALATLLAIAGLLTVGKLGRTGIALLLLWMAASAAALLWLPRALEGLAVGPMLAALLVGVISACRLRPRALDPKTPVRHGSTNRRLTVPLRAVALLLALGLTTRAAAPGPATVYLVPAPGSGGEPRDVLAPVELLDRLALLAEPRLALNDSACLRAAYDGRAADDGTAEFVAHFDVELFADRAAVVLPLSDVRFREVMLDQAIAFPAPAGAGRFGVEVRGKGSHHIDVKFATNITGSGPEREVRFTTPQVPVSRLNFTGPEGAERLRAANWRGVQETGQGGRELRADLGRDGSVIVRWRQPGGTNQVVVRAQEAALWDLDPSGGTLTAVIEYKVTQGTVGAFRVELPPDVLVARVDVRPEAAISGAPPACVKSWTFGQNRLLWIDLQEPLSGTARLLLECVPAKPLTTRPALLAPHALDVGESDGYLAYRLRGLDAGLEAERRSLNEMPPEAFLRDIWKPAAVEWVAASVTRAFRRVKGESPYLRLSLSAAAPATRGRLELVGWFGPHSTEVQGTARWSAAGEPLTFVEWELPATLTLHDVRGLGLYSWQRSGNRVRAWLRQPMAEVNLVWHGALARPGNTAETAVIDWPAVRLLGVGVQSSVLRLRAPEGWLVAPEAPTAVGEPVPPLVDRESAWQLARPAAPVRLVLRGPQPDASYRVLSVAQIAERHLAFTANISAGLRRDRPHSFAVAVRGAQGWQADLEFPTFCRALARPVAPGRAEWLIDVPPRDSEILPFVVRMRLPLNGLLEVALPEVRVLTGDESPHSDRHLLLLGPDLRASEMAGLREEKDLMKTALAPWPRERELLRQAGGSLWKAAAGEDHPRVVASPDGSSWVARLVLADLEAAPLGKRWAYRGSFDLLQVEEVRLGCVLPEGARLEGLALDGELIACHVGDRAFEVSLAGPGRPRLLQVIWSADGPIWVAPRLTAGGRPLDGGAFLWTASAKSGERIDAPGVVSPASAELRRADALLRLAAECAPEREGASLLVGRAGRRLRLAEADLNGPRSPTFAGERGEGGLALADWLSRLREKAAALRGPKKAEPSPVAPRESVYEQMPFADAFRVGRPTRWVAAGPETIAGVSAHPIAPHSSLSELVSFGMVLLAVTFLGLLMLLLPRASRPEQVAVVGLIGLAAFGLPEGLSFLALPAAAVMARGYQVGSRLFRWLGG
jgi:hypothetical protein